MSSPLFIVEIHFFEDEGNKPVEFSSQRENVMSAEGRKVYKMIQNLGVLAHQIQEPEKCKEYSSWMNAQLK
jgi:hypothetical protein